MVRELRPQRFTKTSSRSTVMVLLARQFTAFAGLRRELQGDQTLSHLVFVDRSCTCIPRICNSISRIPGLGQGD